MERLKIVLAVAALLATAHTSPGQQVPVAASGHPTGMSVQPSYVVIGDVQNFNYFPLSAKTTVRQAVIQAGLLSESASVSVVRAAQYRALWTQMISTASADSGEVVQNGDLLVVQSLTPVAGPVQRNAALRTDDGVIVVALADERIAAGDVLLRTNQKPTPEQRLSIPCRFRGRTAVAKATLTDEVAHGDVLTLSRANPAGLKGFGNLVPVVTDWQESALPAPLPPAIPVSDQVQFDGSGDRSETHSPDVLMSIPTSSVESESQTIQMDMPLSDPFAAPLSANTVVADVDAPLSVQLVSQVSPDSASDSPVVAPYPPAEYPELADTVEMATGSAPMSLWNLFFIGGLLVAGTLILAASLRAEDEPEPDQRSTPVQKEELTIHPFAAEKVINLPQMDMDSTDETVASLAPTSRPASGTATSLVSVNEWFGRDWLKTEPSPATTVDDISRRPAPETASEGNAIEERRAEQGATMSASEQSPKASPSTEQVTSEQMAAEQATDIAVNASDIPTRDFADLEDLLQNRLPIDLCTTRLPLRIALYGRPAGPRRLRIDAAHDTLAAPHMVRSGERKREKSGVATDSASGAEDDGSKMSGSLNRALHQLHERTDHDLCD